MEHMFPLAILNYYAISILDFTTSDRTVLQIDWLTALRAGPSWAAGAVGP